jgi:hypothetical protein
MRLLAFGVICAAASFAADTGSSGVTFYRDVLPVLQNNCQECHRPGEAAPMSFLTYDSTRPWAKAMKAAVLTKKMPPWFADPHTGKWSNDRTLPDSAKQTLIAWVDAGAPAGDAKDAPKPIQFTDGWAIPKPDLVFDAPEFDVPASGTIDYQYIVIPTNFKEDTWVQYAEARPGDRVHVHHIIAFVREPGNPWLKDAKPGVPFVPAEHIREAQKRAREQQGGGQHRGRGDGDGGAPGFLVGYAPGVPPAMLAPGQARLVQAGSDIVLQIHYTANGKPGKDRSRVGIVLAKEPPKVKVLTLAASTEDFAIPPGNPNYEVDSKVTLQEQATLVSLLPHMHLRGKDFEYRLVYPTGEKEVLLRVPKYDFSWQLWYTFDKPKVLPAGTTIECTAHYDNSANNAANPDPTKEVHFGEQSWEEMMIGFFDVAVNADTTVMDLMRPKQKSGD